jgi:integrase
MAKGLTADGVKYAKSGTFRREIPDGILPGLYLIVQPSGIKSWAVRYRFEGKPAKYTIGRYPAVQLAAARDLGRSALLRVAEGRNPAGEKAAAKREAKKPTRTPRSKVVLFEEVVEDFIERYAKPNTRDWKNSASMLRRLFVPEWSGMHVGEIAKRDVLDVLEALVEDGMGPGVNRAFSQLRRMFNWLIEKDRLKASPCYGIKKIVQESSRDRYLSDHEIFLFWTVADSMPYPWGPAYKMLLYSGQRLSEVAGCSRVELNGNHWSIPKERTKNKRPQELLLPRQVVSILEPLPRLSYTDMNGVDRKSPFFFTTTGYSPIQGFGKKKEEFIDLMLELARKRAVEAGDDPADVQIEHFTNHDVRRTLATGLGGLKLPAEVVEATLNHVSGKVSGVAKVYNRWKYFEEKGAAVQQWADLVDSIVATYASENVIPMARQA